MKNHDSISWGCCQRKVTLIVSRNKAFTSYQTGLESSSLHCAPTGIFFFKGTISRNCCAYHSNTLAKSTDFWLFIILDVHEFPWSKDFSPGFHLFSFIFIFGFPGFCCIPEFAAMSVVAISSTWRFGSP